MLKQWILYQHKIQTRITWSLLHKHSCWNFRNREIDHLKNGIGNDIITENNRHQSGDRYAHCDFI